jgi:hypothetical protein
MLNLVLSNKQRNKGEGEDRDRKYVRSVNHAWYKVKKLVSEDKLRNNTNLLSSIGKEGYRAK